MFFRYLNKFPYALSGIWYAIRNDFSFQMQLLLITPSIVLFSYIFWPLEKSEILFLGLGYVLILITELQNSSLEEALDRIHPKMHEKIGRSKDMIAGSALMAGFFLIFVMFIIAFF